jgi:uncharacterized protein (DUF427 family)
VRKAINNTSSKGKEIKIPGPDHPITISPAEGKVRVTVAGRIVAESTQALRLEEKGYPPVYYLPRSDAEMSLLLRTTHYTYCPYKGDCMYYSIPTGGEKSEYAVWTYEKPYEAVADIRSTWRFIPRGSMQSKSYRKPQADFREFIARLEVTKGRHKVLDLAC